MKKTFLTHHDVDVMASKVATKIVAHLGGSEPRIYAIPRGGIPAAYLVLKHLARGRLVDDPAQANVILDDLIDSGTTMAKFDDQMQACKVALLDKREDDLGWVVFPWEENEISGGEDFVIRLMQFIGEDPSRGGLLETPKRVLNAWKHWGSGYDQNPADILKVFEDGAEKCDEMVVVRDIPIYSHCEHHMAPFFGVAHIGYIPNGKIVGLSKLSRLADIFARRLQVQERLTTQIADALDEHLEPLGAGVVIECRHMCMESRGVQRQGSSTVTSALRGAFKDNPDARREFLDLVRSK